jgi:hypothetical protein
MIRSKVGLWLARAIVIAAVLFIAWPSLPIGRGSRKDGTLRLPRLPDGVCTVLREYAGKDAVAEILGLGRPETNALGDVIVTASGRLLRCGPSGVLEVAIRTANQRNARSFVRGAIATSETRVAQVVPLAPGDVEGGLDVRSTEPAGEQHIIVFRRGPDAFVVLGSAPSRADTVLNLASNLSRSARAGPSHLVNALDQVDGAKLAGNVLGIWMLTVSTSGWIVARQWRSSRKSTSRPAFYAPASSGAATDALPAVEVSKRVRGLKWTARGALLMQGLAVILVGSSLQDDGGIPSSEQARIYVFAILLFLGGRTIRRRFVDPVWVHWSHPPSRAERRLSLDRRWLASVAWRAIGWFLFLLAAASLVILALASSSAPGPWQPLQLAALVLTIFLFAAAVRSLRRARGLVVASASEALQRQGIAPLLYLRSFDDDSVAVGARFSSRRSWLENIAYRGKDRLEEIIAWQLQRLGPVVGLGRPGESIPSFGAARDQAESTEWQRSVFRWMQPAQLVMIVLGRTEGLQWEITTLADLGLLDRTILIVPPDRNVRPRWAMFEAAVRAAGHAVVAPPHLEKTLVIAPAVGPTAIAFESRSRGEWDYEVALAAALDVLKTKLDRADARAGPSTLRKPSPARSSVAHHRAAELQ